MLTPIYLDMRNILSQVWAKYWIFKNLCTKYMANSEAMTSSTRSFAYSYRLVKKCFVKICETSKCHNFLIFQPIFIRFSLFCSENFTLSSEIMSNLFRSSPLKRRELRLELWCGLTEGGKYSKSSLGRSYCARSTIQAKGRFASVGVYYVQITLLIKYIPQWQPGSTEDLWSRPWLVLAWLLIYFSQTLLLWRVY